MSKKIANPVLFSMFLVLILSGPGMVMAQDTSDEFHLPEYAATKKVTMQFVDVPVTDFVEFLQEQAPELNILIRSDVQDVLLPRLILRNVTVDTALRSLEELSLNALIVQLDDSEEYYIIGPNPDRMIQSVEVLNVSRFLMDTKTQSISPEKKEHLMSAIEAGQKMLASSSGSIKISLHPTTGLLFVKGSFEETNLVIQIVDELVNNPIDISGAGARNQSNKPAGGGQSNLGPVPTDE